MIRQTIETIKEFKKRGGYHIFISTLISKVTQVVLIMFIVRLINPREYGELAFIQSYITFFIPFSGLGLNYSLLRYGSIERKDENKIKIFSICLKYGVIFSFFLYLLVSFIAYLADFEIVTNYIYVLIFAVLLLSDYLKEIAQSYLRIKNKNIEFAYSNITYSIGLLLLTVSGTFLAGVYGFIFSRVVVPAIIFLIIIVKENNSLLKIKKFGGINLKEYASYGTFVGLGSVASQLMFQIDNFLLGIMGVGSEIIAEYKIATVIPFAVLFIPSVFMTTDFVLIAEKYKDKNFLVSYRNRMMKVLFLISFVGLIISLFFSDQILGLLYGDNYSNSGIIMNILMVGIIASFALRAPNGNILSAVGKSRWNAILAYSTVIFNVILNYYFISKFSHYGAAIATSIVMWVTGIISYLLFNKYIKELEAN